MENIPGDWLEQINRRLSDAGVPYKQRPWHAMRAWSLERNIGVRFPSPTSEHIFGWFYRNSPAEAHHIGSLFTGLFYFDVYFWPVDIPIAYGKVKLDPFVSIRAMPDLVKARLRNDKIAHLGYLGLWADCVDYGFGRDDLRGNSAITGFAASLFKAANEQLEATISVLRETRPNSKAMEFGRMATEMFLKSFLAAHVGLTEQEAKKRINHDLELALKECLAARPASELFQLQVRLSQFPDVNARYAGATYSHDQLWSAYGTAQFVGSAVMRSLTDRNMRRTLESAHSPAPRRA